MKDLHDLSRALFDFGSHLVHEANAQTTGDCIKHASALLRLFNEQIDSCAELTDTQANIGVAFLIDPPADSSATRRNFHAFNFLAGHFNNFTAAIEMDAYFGTAHMTKGYEPIALVKRLPPGRLIIYAQTTPGDIVWTAGFTDNLRCPPFEIDPTQRQIIVMDEVTGTEALDQLKSANPDKTKIPVLKIRHRPTAHPLLELSQHA